MKVQVAIARKMLTAVWYILHDNVPYRDFTPDIVRSIYLWWLDHVYKLTHALCGLGRQCVAIEPEEEIVLSSPHPPAYNVVGCLAIESGVGKAIAGNVYAGRRIGFIEEI